ncbi:hypothetical protein [Bizionia myxarmorum]|uniref:Uncharacterized protein n=1 Tax=Bizionia myxarmorum TaxID=291186 RepID=A0A5D0R5M3_9FLAO|nr:hypothetical protein [Bizionia myxarmorum]TYB76161.1 hypothetical protein ES674_11190 [Bizionia myxarmorum]
MIFRIRLWIFLDTDFTDFHGLLGLFQFCGFEFFDTDFTDYTDYTNPPNGGWVSRIFTDYLVLLNFTDAIDFKFDLNLNYSDLVDSRGWGRTKL